MGSSKVTWRACSVGLEDDVASCFWLGGLDIRSSSIAAGYGDFNVGVGERGGGMDVG
jgi:hypothetical protein